MIRVSLDGTKFVELRLPAGLDVAIKHGLDTLILDVWPGISKDELEDFADLMQPLNVQLKKDEDWDYPVLPTPETTLEELTGREVQYLKGGGIISRPSNRNVLDRPMDKDQRDKIEDAAQQIAAISARTLEDNARATLMSQCTEAKTAPYISSEPLQLSTPVSIAMGERVEYEPDELIAMSLAGIRIIDQPIKEPSNSGTLTVAPSTRTLPAPAPTPINKKAIKKAERAVVQLRPRVTEHMTPTGPVVLSTRDQTCVECKRLVDAEAEPFIGELCINCTVPELRNAAKAAHRRQQEAKQAKKLQPGDVVDCKPGDDL